jgi:hypothetical protein
VMECVVRRVQHYVALRGGHWFSGRNLWTISNMCSFISTLHFL